MTQMIEAMSPLKSRVQSCAQALAQTTPSGVRHGPARPRFRPRLRHDTSRRKGRAAIKYCDGEKSKGSVPAWPVHSLVIPVASCVGRSRVDVTSNRRPIDEVIEVFERWLILKDPTPLYAVFGPVAANLLPGDPVWLGLIAPPSSAKTKIFNSLSGVPKVVRSRR